MDYSRSNHNQEYEMPFVPVNAPFFLPHFNVCPSASVHHSYRQHSTGPHPFQSPLPKATTSPSHTHSNLEWKKAIFILSSVSAISVAL